jgi:hypothetical protein
VQHYAYDIANTVVGCSPAMETMAHFPMLRNESVVRGGGGETGEEL